MNGLALPEKEIGAYCAAQPICRLSVFGSALTERFGPESDVDLLVELDPAAKVGYFKLVQMEDALSKIVGRQVDLRTVGELSRYFREKVVRQARPIYVRG